MKRTEALEEFDQREFERLSEQGYLRLGGLLSADDLDVLRPASRRHHARQNHL